MYIAWGKGNFLELNASKTKAMLVGTRAKLNTVLDPTPFNAGNSRILFVKSFVYLGSTLDNELTLEPLYKNVCRQVDQKLRTDSIIVYTRYLCSMNHHYTDLL